jgi:hypothetical protein
MSWSRGTLRERLHPAEAPVREEQPDRATREAENHAFDQQLPHDPPAARPERRPDGQLLPAAQAARQQQVRDVRARDEEHARHGADEHADRSAHAADHLILERHDAERQAAVRRIEIREVAAKADGEGVHFLLHLSDGHARPETADDVVVLAVPRLRGVRSHGEGHDDVRVKGVAECRHHFVRKGEGRRQDADDLIGASVQFDPAANHVRIAAVAAYPGRVGEKCGIRRRLRVFLRREEPSGCGAHAEHREQVGRHAEDGDPFGLAVAGQVLVRAVDEGGLLEPRAAVLDVEVLARREPVLGNAEAR